MSFLSALGKVGKSIIGLAPGGGTLNEVISGIGSVASGAAKGQADQRITQGNQALNYAQLAQQAARDKYASDLSGANAQFGADLAGSNAQFGAGMQGAQFGREGQDRARKAAVLSQLLGNTKDFQVTPGNPAIAKAMGTSTGGARPSNLTTHSEALQALLAQPQIDAPTYAAPSKFAAPTQYQAPVLPTAPKAGIAENILGGIGLGGNFLAALGQYKNGGPQQSQAVADPNNAAAVNAELLKRGFMGAATNPYSEVRF